MCSIVCLFLVFLFHSATEAILLKICEPPLLPVPTGESASPFMPCPSTSATLSRETFSQMHNMHWQRKSKVLLIVLHIRLEIMFVRRKKIPRTFQGVYILLENSFRSIVWTVNGIPPVTLFTHGAFWISASDALRYQKNIFPLESMYRTIEATYISRILSKSCKVYPFINLSLPQYLPSANFAAFASYFSYLVVRWCLNHSDGDKMGYYLCYTYLNLSLYQLRACMW